MRVLEPHHFKHSDKKPARKKSGVAFLSVLLVLVAVGGAYYYFAIKPQLQRVDVPTEQPTIAPAVPANKVTPQLKPKIFTGNQFKDLYRSVMETYPNTEAFSPPPSIMGDSDADARIRTLAEARGFRLTRLPVTALIKTNEPSLSGETDDLLQPLAYKGWQEIKAAAKKDGVPLTLLSAYRSPEWQRDLFMDRLSARGVTASQVMSGQADAAINANFTVTAVPGYSRHHTGYAVDFQCEDGSGNFGASSCFTWLNENNYLHAKEHGWIPSYPPGADEQGPEPEPWEYVWVGKDLLYE